MEEPLGWLHTPSGPSYPLHVGPNYIGRSYEDCDVCLESSATVSSRHAVLTLQRDRKGEIVTELRDLGSLNGCFHNSSPIVGGDRERIVRSGDMLRFGYEKTGGGAF